MVDKCMHKWWERLVLIKHHEIIERHISRRQPISSVVYLIVKSDVIPFEQTKGICIWKKWKSKPKHNTSILCWRFEVICYKYEQCKNSTWSSSNIFTRHQNEIWRVKVCLFNNKRRKQICTTEILEMNGTKIQPIKEDIIYKYLGFDENVSYNGSLKGRLSAQIS